MMKTEFGLVSTLIAFALLASGAPVSGQEIQPIKLLNPRTTGGMPLMQALKERRSSRAFSPKELPLPVLSDLLWAANGMNRPESGGRTAPSVMNMQEIDIYVAKSDGVYLFDAEENVLLPVSGEDIRGLTGRQAFVKEVPVNLIYVADFSKIRKISGSEVDFYTAADAGFIGQNVYLYCASAGLVTVVRGAIDKPALATAMKLRDDQKILLAQSVGYPGGTANRPLEP
ncbi:MAG TPA: SagB/ThcOx family dehydrogenase [Candidatus Omnitrophota bacterium]|jgi:nitroreductase|nr:SagB/ThcOx family dehydrogenase [Candidatus Omnitrophota bacterium]HPN55743.1 SagB/ThcOx family dehydrogenase [Candidatus Omnitrophota bacterium]